MSTIEFQELIGSVLTEVQETEAKAEKQVVPTEEQINEVLDLIITFKKEIIEQATSIEGITESLEKITWFKIEDEKVLGMLVNTLGKCKSLRKSVISRYIAMNRLRSDGIARDEIHRYKLSIDEFTEAYNDVEFVFIIAPKDSEFCDITKQIESL